MCSSFPLLAHLRGSILWAKPNLQSLLRSLVESFIHLVYLIVWLNRALWSSGIWVFIHLLPINPCPLRFIPIHYNPIQYFIIYFSILWNGITLIPFNYFISMEFFTFLSKFFSSYSWGMVRVNFFVGLSISTFEFWSRLGVWLSHHCWFSSPPDRVFLGGHEFGCRLSYSGFWSLPCSYFNYSNDG